MILQAIACQNKLRTSDPSRCVAVMAPRCAIPTNSRSVILRRQPTPSNQECAASICVHRPHLRQACRFPVHVVDHGHGGVKAHDRQPSGAKEVASQQRAVLVAKTSTSSCQVQLKSFGVLADGRDVLNGPAINSRPLSSVQERGCVAQTCARSPLPGCHHASSQGHKSDQCQLSGSG